jgi:hypothetical protein
MLVFETSVIPQLNNLGSIATGCCKNWTLRKRRSRSWLDQAHDSKMRNRDRDEVVSKLKRLLGTPVRSVSSRQRSVEAGQHTLGLMTCQDICQREVP